MCLCGHVHIYSTNFGTKQCQNGCCHKVVKHMKKEQKAQLDCFEHWTNVSEMIFNSIKCKIMPFKARIRASPVNWELKPGNDRRRK